MKLRVHLVTQFLSQTECIDFDIPDDYNIDVKPDKYLKVELPNGSICQFNWDFVKYLELTNIAPQRNDK